MFVPMKMVWLFVTPSTVCVGLVVIGTALLFTRLQRYGRSFALAGTLGLVVFGVDTVPAMLLRPLEGRVPPTPAGESSPEGLIVLGGGVGRVRGEIALYEPGRMIAAAQLAKRYPQAKVIFSGGDASLMWSADETEAQAAKAMFAAVGIAPERVVLDDRSRNTRENAVYTRALVGANASGRWILITSAFHMPRALGAFRAVGLHVDVYPTDYRTKASGFDYLPEFGRVPRSLRDSDAAVKEWLALVAYRLAGYTDQLLPATHGRTQPSS